MDVIRNFIRIAGITPENQLPDKALGQMIQYSDIETIFIPEDKSGARNILQIIIGVEITSTRIISAPLFKTIAIDGIKKLKIIYTENDGLGNANYVVLEIPYNTFIELPKEYESVSNVEVFIMDAYFSLLDPRKIYSYTLYLVHVCHTPHSSKKQGLISPAVMEEILLSEQTAQEIRLPEENTDDMPIQNNFIDIDAEYL